MEQKFSRRELAEIEELKEQRVVVRVWTSTHKNGKLDSIGHISIDTTGTMDGVETTNGYYISFWPQNPNVGLKNTGEVFPAYFVTSLKEDASEEREKRYPEHTFCFYTLVPVAMNLEFERFKNGKPEWTLAPISGKTGDAESCISLARRILMRGNLGELITTFDRAKISFVGSSQASGKGSSAGALTAAYAIKGDKQQSKIQSGESQVQSVRAVEHALALLVESPDAWVPILEKAREVERQDEKIRSLYFKGETFPDAKNISREMEMGAIPRK